MINQIQATLECEVCGAGWVTGGEVFDFRESSNWLKPLGVEFLVDESQECPECGEADAWGYGVLELKQYGVEGLIEGRKR